MPPPPPPLLLPPSSKGDADSLKDAEAYLRDSGVAFNEQDDRVYEQARRARSRGRGRGLISPPLGALPPTPVSPPVQQPPRSPPADKSYAELFTAFQKQQQAIARLRAANEEHARNAERLSADLLAMTHRYLQAQASVDILERRCKDADEQLERLALRLEEGNVTGRIVRTPESLPSPRIWHTERRGTLTLERRNDDHGDTATVSAGTVDSSDYVSVDLTTALNIPPPIPPEEVLKIVRTINVQICEVARSCISSATFRPGVRMMQVDNQMVVTLTEAVGCILVQHLRSKDHSKNKATIELALRALLSYHVSKLVENWPFHTPTKRKSRDSDKGTEEIPTGDRDEYGTAIENVLRDVATILSLSGSSGQPSSLIRSHRDRIGSTLDVLLRTAEGLASQIKGGRFDGALPPDYSFLYARPGATFNKDLMQKQSGQQSMAIWKSTQKKSVTVLCTREVGLARLHRKPVSSSSMSIASSRSGSSGQSLAPDSKEIEVLSKVVVVFESDLDK